MRLFVAIVLPDDVARSLAFIQTGVPGARWATRDQMHLTLRFIGEVDGRDVIAIDDALRTIRAPSFPLLIKGVGEFCGKRPHALWAGVASNNALNHLQRKIETALQRVGVEADTRKFTPHVTLARLKGATRGRVMDYLVDHALFAATPFEATGFILYSSILTPNGSVYRAEKAYPLK